MSDHTSTAYLLSGLLFILVIVGSFGVGLFSFVLLMRLMDANDTRTARARAYRARRNL